MHLARPTPDVDADEADAVELPCAEALLAAVVALMSAHANPAPDARVDPDTHRRLLARKVVSNLFFLRQHPALSAPLRRVMAQAHAHWATLAAAPVVAAPAASAGGWMH